MCGNDGGGAWRVSPEDTYEVARLTGPGSVNRTDTRWGVRGTDLGHMFTHRGRVYFVFGDTFGRRPGAWRSNVMAWADPEQDPARGIAFAGMVTGWRGRAKQLIGRGQVPGTCVTVIPTYGVSTGDAMVLHYMAVREWGTPGGWRLDHSGLARSGNDGRSWRPAGVSWPGDSGFGQVAMARSGGHIYLFGIPGGRFGACHLARVPADRLLDPTAYEYWEGADWASGDPGRARAVVEPPVGELSVRWSPHYESWLMLHLDVRARAVVLRMAPQLVGPWSQGQEVVSGRSVRTIYAPYLSPWWNDGADIWFTLSRYNYYNVFWWHTSLRLSGLR